MFIACGVFAYSINSIGQIFQSIFYEENELNKKLIIIKNYMRNKNISFEL